MSESTIRKNVAIIERYQKSHKPHKIDLGKIVSPEQWKDYENSIDAIFKAIENAQSIAKRFKNNAQNAVDIYLDTEKQLRTVG